MGTIEYRFRELGIASNKNDERRILPTLRDSDKVILDIGCGVGQTFIALKCTDRICIGLDVDHEAIRYGMSHYGHGIQFIVADASRIPIPSESVNFVFSRVSLPYTNIPKVIKEIERVLTNDGRVWMTLHDRNVVRRYLRQSMGEPFRLKEVITQVM